MVDHIVVGGGSRAYELLPGYRFNTHSAAHNIINSTGIVEELALGAVGLEYREMDPFSVAVHRDGAIVRFHRSVERTVASIREVAPEDADRYRWRTDSRKPRHGGYRRTRYRPTLSRPAHWMTRSRRRATTRHTTPVTGLFITGAGTAPVGGVAGSPGRAAARAVLTWRRRRSR